jgi:hypothetical protein
MKTYQFFFFMTALLAIAEMYVATIVWGIGAIIVTLTTDDKM